MQNIQYIEYTIYILIFVRIISFIGTSPIFMIRGIPNLVKIGFGLLLSLLIFNFVGYDPKLLPVSLIGLISVAMGECLLGLVLGYVTTLFISGMRMAGQLMDIQIGFSQSSEFDMLNSGNVTLVGNLSNLTAIVIFFLVDGHHILIEFLIKSYSVVPLLGVNIPPEVSTYVLTLFIKLMILSLKLAAPVLIVLLLTDLAMGLISRTVPQLNVMMMGMPVKMLVGMLALSAAFPGIIYIYIKSLQDIQGDINNLFKLFPIVFLFASGEKTEEPTQKKLDDARKKGQVAKSKEFVSAVTLIGITILAISASNYGMQTLQIFLSRSLQASQNLFLGEGDITSIFIFSFIEFLKVTVPVFVVVMLLGVISNLAQTGFITSSDPLKMQLNRLNPIEGFKKMFSMKAVMEMLKACANIAIIGYAAYSFLSGEIYRIVKISDMSINSIFTVPMDIAKSLLIRISIIISIIGIIDLIYQKYAYKKELRMTKQEIKEEYKQMEGDPQIKSKIRQRQREMASRRMMHEVPKATVVVTNPTHLAVALKYDKDKSNTPFVVAKGADDIAVRIRELAKDNKVPIIENKPVARMLYEKSELGEEIPVEMYQAVAEILAIVYSLKKKTL